ncbi:MAG: hypothetical protein IH950_11705 [Bacteroidetes bacterium]|nr:hypothetical protein [Bacteroidota bacterium]
MESEQITNKPKITDWISGISTFVLVIITGIYVYLTFDLIEQNRNQMSISQDPVIEILPKETIKGDVGEFELWLHNLGISDIKEIEIFEDYFVSLTPKGENIQLYRFGPFVTLPNSKLTFLAKKDSIKFKISFKAINDDMSKFYSSDLKGHRIKIVKLQVKFRRALDGKEYSKLKAYIIAGHGDFLIDYNTMRDIKIEDIPTFKEIKNILGILD